MLPVLMLVMSGQIEGEVALHVQCAQVWLTCRLSVIRHNKKEERGYGHVNFFSAA